MTTFSKKIVAFQQKALTESFVDPHTFGTSTGVDGRPVSRGAYPMTETSAIVTVGKESPTGKRVQFAQAEHDNGIVSSVTTLKSPPPRVGDIRAVTYTSETRIDPELKPLTAEEKRKLLKLLSGGGTLTKAQQRQLEDALTLV